MIFLSAMVNQLNRIFDKKKKQLLHEKFSTEKMAKCFVISRRFTVNNIENY